jgi:hypothetical protein
MKKLKLCVFGLVLFLQACSDPEVPLFNDEEGINPKDAVVVFNMYTTDSKLTESSGLFGERSLENIYVHNYWKGLAKEAVVFKVSNHLRVDGIKSRYVVAKVAPGNYYFQEFFRVYSYSTGSYIYTMTLSSPEYNLESTPLTFTVNAGEVKYLGDIEIQRSTLSKTSWIPLYKVHNRFSDAKKLISKKYPSLQTKMTQSLVQKTQNQVLLERKYSTGNTDTLLNEVKNAK